MTTNSALILAVPADELRAAQPYGLLLAHMAYRIGGGPHLFRANLPVPVHGGLMLVDDAGFDGRGDPGPFCQEVMRECAARGYTGVICDFEGQSPLLSRILTDLSGLLARQNWPLYLPEQYAHCAPTARVLVSSAVSGGSLKGRLSEATARYGAGRVVLAVERVAEDFFLPSPTGGGTPLTREALKQRIEKLAPSIFFSAELCAHYFTYMNRQSGAHFILYDDAASIRQKRKLAQSLGIRQALLFYAELSDLLPELLA